jgi:hypothetical protein
MARLWERYVRQRGIVVWGWIGWSIVVLTVWVAVAAFVGVVLGRAVRRRDRQVPTSTPDTFPTPRVPVEPPMTERRRRS